MKILLNEEIIADDVKHCKSFLSKLKGLMFSKKLKENQAIILENNKESKLDTGIHMLFVFQKLKIVWLNSEKEIVDIKIAYPFISFLYPKKPAKYVLELNPKRELQIGEKIIF